jgi:hypothetical protein
MDSIIFATTFLPRRIWSRAPALLVARVSSSRHFLVAVLPVRKHPSRHRFLVPVTKTLQIVIERFLP